MACLFACLPRFTGSLRAHYLAPHLLRLLLASSAQAGADVDKASTYGCTPLIYAVGAKKTEVVEILLQHNANTAPVAESGQHVSCPVATACVVRCALCAIWGFVLRVALRYIVCCVVLFCVVLCCVV